MNALRAHSRIRPDGVRQNALRAGGHVKNVPGRKTDFADAEWLVHLLG